MQVYNGLSLPRLFNCGAICATCAFGEHLQFVRSCYEARQENKANGIEYKDWNASLLSNYGPT